MKIQVAIARKVLVAIWHMLTKQEDFVDYYLEKLKREQSTQSEDGTTTTSSLN